MDSPLWLSHHWAHESDRCVVLRGRPVCRRCAVLYPIAAVVLAVGVVWPVVARAAWVPWLMMLAPVPVTVEWIAEHVGAASYRPRRQTVLTALAAPALGIGLARYLRSPGDRWFWIMVGVHGGLCALAMVMGLKRYARQLAQATQPSSSGSSSNS